MELRNGIIVAAAAIMPGIVTEFVEQILTAGSFGWIPVIANAIGGISALIVVLIIQSRQPDVLAGNFIARNVRATTKSAAFAVMGFIAGLIVISQSGGYLGHLPSIGFSQVTPTPSPTPVPPLDRKLKGALSISRRY